MADKIGRNYKFPIQLKDGDIETSSDTTYVNEVLTQLFESKKASSYFEPDFGARFFELLFEMPDAVFESFALEIVNEGFGVLPTLQRAAVKFNHEGNKTYIIITYTHKSTGVIEDFNLTVNRG